MDHVNPLPGLLGFTRALAAAGVRVPAQRATAFTEATAQVDVADPQQLYWAGRATLCSEPDDIGVYERVFHAWFGEPPRTSSLPNRATEPRTARSAALVTTSTEAAEQDPELKVAASEQEVLRQRDLAEMSESEREHLRRLLSTLDTRPPLRTSQRRQPSHRGTLDPNRTLRAMLADGGEPIHLRRRAKAKRPRRVVLLLDVSGSMSPYADALLRFAHVLGRSGPVETFTIGTRLTRVTRALRARDPELALSAAGRTVPDWAGGTRLGEAIRAFCDRWGQRGLARRSVVVVFSDGWERGDAALLGEQMARLRRLASRVLWVNPHAGKSGYRPVQSGIQAALPHVDTLLAGHSLETLENLLQEVRDA